MTKILTKKSLMLASFMSATLLTACQSLPNTTAPVIPRADATFDTSGMGKTRNIAISDAMFNANITCKKARQSRVVVIKDDIIYKGVIDEETGSLIDKVGKAIGVLAGQKMPTAASDTDYEARIKFKCVK